MTRCATIEGHILAGLHGRKLPPCICGWPETCCRRMYPQWHPDEPPEPSTYFDGETWRSR